FTFVMPEEWFPAQRSFPRSNDERGGGGGWPGNQATNGLETRLLRRDLQQLSGLETRLPNGQVAWKPGHQWPGNQATEPPSSMATRLPVTQNQQLGETGANDQINQHHLVPENTDDLISQIRRCAKVENHQLEDAVALQEAMRSYMRALGPQRCWDDPIGEELL